MKNEINVEDDPFKEFPKDFDDELFDLEAILLKFKESRNFLMKYRREIQIEGQEVHRHLYKKERKCIVKYVMNWIINKKILLRRCDFLKIVDRIKFMFPKEPAFLYYTAPVKMNLKSSKEQQKTSSHEEDGVKLKKNKRTQKGPTGLLFSSYRYRCSKERKEVEEGERSTFYR